MVAGHATVQIPTGVGQLDQHPASVAGVSGAGHEAVVHESGHDAMTRAVGDEQRPGQVRHRRRFAGDGKLVEHVVVVEAPPEGVVEADVEERHGPPVEPDEQLPGLEVRGRLHGTMLATISEWKYLPRETVEEDMTTTTPTLEIRRAADRDHTRIGWLDSWHSFSFGSHYSPTNTNHGQLLVLNDDRVASGSGFDTHPHRDMEIVTWVLDGELVHKDSEGNHGRLYPGLAQRMSAGRGIWHSEMNGSATDEVHFIQMWVVPDTEGVQPGYEQQDVNERLAAGGLVPVASGSEPDAAITIHQQEATLWAGRLGPNETVAAPAAPFAHLFVAKGQAELEAAGSLGTGDAVRLTGQDDLRLVAGPEGAEVLIWTTGPLTTGR